MATVSKTNAGLIVPLLLELINYLKMVPLLQKG